MYSSLCCIGLCVIMLQLHLLDAMEVDAESAVDAHGRNAWQDEQDEDPASEAGETCPVCEHEVRGPAPRLGFFANLFRKKKRDVLCDMFVAEFQPTGKKGQETLPTKKEQSSAGHLNRKSNCDTGCCAVVKQYTGTGAARSLKKIIGECCHQNDYSYCRRSDYRCTPSKDLNKIDRWLCAFDDCNKYTKVRKHALTEKANEEKEKKRQMKLDKNTKTFDDIWEKDDDWTYENIH